MNLNFTGIGIQMTLDPLYRKRGRDGERARGRERGREGERMRGQEGERAERE